MVTYGFMDPMGVDSVGFPVNGAMAGHRMTKLQELSEYVVSVA